MPPTHDITHQLAHPTHSTFTNHRTQRMPCLWRGSGPTICSSLKFEFAFSGRHCTKFWLPVLVVFETWNLKFCGTKSLRIIKLIILAWKIHNFQISFFVMASIIFVCINFHNFLHAPLIWHHNIFPCCRHNFPLWHPHTQPMLSIKRYQHQYQPPPLELPDT